MRRRLLRAILHRIPWLAGNRARPYRVEPLNLAVLSPGAEGLPPDADLIYAPETMENRLDADALDNALLCFSHQDYDFVVVSRSLAELPHLAVPRGMRQSVVFTREAADAFLRGAPPSRRLHGRLIRMPGLRDDSEKTELHQLMLADHDAAEIFWGNGPLSPIRVWDCSRMAFRSRTARARPLIFVWPVFMAVGGVERNVIEVMRQLRSRYDFIVVTIERLNERLGSLHHQLKGLAVATYDLAEVGTRADFLSMLSTLKRAWEPDLVWICNGSPWQCDHAEDIRKLYAETPIVDQEIYDTSAGWITRYREPGIQSFDRFIAINSRIRDKLVLDFGMEPGKVDLIYHAVDVSRFRPDDYPPERVAILKREYDLTPGRPIILFAGRMTMQKRPLDFVRLADRVASGGIDANFLMLGDGDLGHDVDAAIAHLKPGLVRRVPFTDRVPELMAVVDGLVITSEFEGLPIAMLEALAMGIPVLSTDVGDVRLVLETYGAGAIVPRIGDENALLAAFLAWFRELARWRQASMGAAEKIRGRFSAARAAAEYEQCWKRAMRARTSRGR